MLVTCCEEQLNRYSPKRYLRSLFASKNVLSHLFYKLSLFSIMVIVLLFSLLIHGVSLNACLKKKKTKCL